MRTFSIVMAVVTAILVIVVGYAALTTDVGVSVVATSSEPASNQYEAFTMATAWARENDNTNVTRFTDSEADVADCSIVYLTVEVSNWCYLPAEWVQLHVQPASGDILQIRQDSGRARGLGKTTFQAVLITSAANPNVGRQVEVEYYIFGRKYTAMSDLVTG